MEHLLNFKNDKKRDAFETGIKIKNFIENFVTQPHIKILLNKFANITSIPENILSNKSKKTMLSHFIYSEGKFNKNFKFFKTLQYSFVYLAICFSCIFFSKKRRKIREKYDIILDDIHCGQ